MDTFNVKNFSCKLRQELPVKYQLARSLEFFMEELDRDKKIIFGCGLEVRGNAKDSRFLIRIYLLHHEKWRCTYVHVGHINMSLDSFFEIARSKSERDFVKLDQEDFTLTVESKDRQFQFSNREGLVISINEKILEKMMSCESDIMNYERSCALENQIYADILNLIAYNWNEKKDNDWIHAPAECCTKGGAETTLKKLIDQISKAKAKKMLSGSLK